MEQDAKKETLPVQLAFPAYSTCVKCGQTWRNQVAVPRQCPRCHRYDWQGKPPRVKVKCAKCGFEWRPLVESPVHCPGCKTRHWRL